MAQQITIRFGLRADLPTLKESEFAYCIDTKQVFIGSFSGNLEITNLDKIGDLSDLTTVDKSTVVAAINEINNSMENGGSEVEDSQSNGYLTVDGAEIQVYDDTGKANLEHKHTLTDLTDVDVANKTNGYALQYDSTTEKFVSKALPESSGGTGATSLDGLSDVDTSTIVPTEGDVLKFVEGIWQPRTDGTGGNLIIETFAEGELVELEDSVPPEEISNLQASNASRNELTLTWDQSVSSDVMKYNIYQDGSLIDTLDYITRKKVVTGLTVYTTYTFKVTTVDDEGNESDGKEITTQTAGYRLKMNGFTGVYLIVPSFTYDELIMEFMVEKAPNTFYLDGRLDLSLCVVETRVDGLEYFGYFDEAYVDGVRVTSPGSWLPDQEMVELKLLKKRVAPSTGKTKIFSDRVGNHRPVGEIARLRFLNKGVLLADYNFRMGSFDDQTGNGNSLIQAAGEFI